MKWQRWWPRYEVLKAARRAYTGPNKLQKWEFKCCKCKGWFLQREVEVDHIVPCGSLKSFEDIAGFVKRLFVEKEGLRVVCKPCHLVITKQEKQ